jgi:peptidyl-prolyl cis-trans isomerase C
VVRHHALMELQFARITGQAPKPDDLAVLAWYQRNQEKFRRPEQRLTHHLLLTVDDDSECAPPGDAVLPGHSGRT